MSDNDRLYRFVLENTRVRGEIVHLNATWQAVLERAEYPPIVRNILGQALAATVLLAATIKFNGALILQVRGDGPLNLLVTQATSAGTLRGLARWQSEVPDGDLQQQFGNGQMVITIEPKDGEAYQGIIALQGDSIAAAIEAYFTQSEQLNTRLWLASSETACAGFLLQELPAENKSHENWEHALHLATTLSRDEMLTLDAQEILHRLYHQDDVRLFDPTPVSFRCSCSRERIDKVLLSLGMDEARSILEEQGRIDVDCEFCNAHYSYDAVDVEALFAENVPTDSSRTRH